ncbi:MAG: hypothetical protein JO202_07615, partial [Ktedonobacteraceae bacterium]|nr:hypothetical protein [Ktedonobacteraceae bacterium]
MKRKAVITGIGLITPGGITLPEVWETLLRGQSTARPIDIFDVAPYPVTKAGIVEDRDIFEPFPARSLKRMDRFCSLAMAATHRALQDSGIDLQKIEPSSAGVYIGNMYGGWGVTDPSLRRLLTNGYREVSPYVASAWFPTAPQGQITIHWGLEGYSKTIIADTASSALAIGYAAQAIEEERADVMLAGGAESPITPYTYSFCVRSGRLNPAGYRFFDPEGTGFLVGEGAVILVLEELRAAQQRHAHIYAEVAGWATCYLPRANSLWSDEGKRFSRLITQALDNAQVTPDEIDYLGLDAQGILVADSAEAQAVGRAFATSSQQPLATTCKPTLTHLLG